MRSSAAALIYRTGAASRNPSLWKEYERLKKSEWMSRRDLEELQLERAIEFLEFAERHSRFSAARFEQAGLRPRSLRSISELQALPAIGKADLISHNQAIHSSHAFARVFKAETSGTSGVALEFDKNEKWDSINRAHILRSYDWYNVKPWDRNGYLWGYNIAPNRARRVRALDSLQNRFRLFKYDGDSVRAFASRLTNAIYLSGYSSMIYEVAKIINRLGIQTTGLRMIKGTSEMIIDAYQAEAQRAFGQKIISEYGAAEAGLIAFECPSGSMHINVEDVVLDVGDDGEAIVTNLASYSFPIIRYRLGDTVRVSPNPCSCGRQHPVLTEVIGRRGGTVVGRDTRYPALTFYYVFKNLAIEKGLLLNYRVVQVEPGHCVLMVEGVANQQLEASIMEELNKYFQSDVDFDLRFLSELPRGGRKAQYFESKIP